MTPTNFFLDLEGFFVTVTVLRGDTVSLDLAVLFGLTVRFGFADFFGFVVRFGFAVFFGVTVCFASAVCLILIYAQEGVTEQDTKVAGLAHDAGKACIIVVNKWDLIEKDGKTMDRMREDIRRDLSYMPYAPILFISALTGQRVGRLFELINYVNDQAAMRITTGTLNSVLADAQTRVQPPTDKGRRLKIYYMTQVGVKPPHFVIFCNDKKLFHFSYQRYLENQLRSVFGLEGTPIVLTIRQKGEDDG